MIGFIIAMEEEITSIKEIDKNVKVYQTDFYKYYLFEKNQKEFVLVFCGIGKVNAAGACLEIIKTFSVKQLINIGICGSPNSHILYNQILLLTHNYYLDVDLTDFGYEYGQVAKDKPFYENNNQLTNQIVAIFENNKIEYKKAIGATSDSFINDKNIKNFNDELLKKIDCVDMEATAIKQIAKKAKVETAFIKIVSDYIFSNSKNDYYATKNEWPKKITNLIKLICNQI